MKDIFTKIADKNIWQSSESLSGTGSTYEITQAIRYALPIVFAKYEIKSLLDLPCGDFNWQHKLLPYLQSYIGGDIVPSIIKSLQIKHGGEMFREMNLCESPLPKADCILVRDCLVHLPFADCMQALQNIKASGSRYLLITSFANKQNRDLRKAGGWRKLNMQALPFDLGEPIARISEDSPEAKDKALLLFALKCH